MDTPDIKRFQTRKFLYQKEVFQCMTVERNRSVFENKHGVFLSTALLDYLGMRQTFRRASLSPRRSLNFVCKLYLTSKPVIANSVVLRQPLATVKHV